MTEQALALPPVVADLIEDGYLDVDNLSSTGLLVKISFNGFSDQDEVDVTWYGVDNNGTVYDWHIFTRLSPSEPAYDPSTQTLSVYVPADSIRPAKGGQAFLSWNYQAKGNIAFIPSPRLVVDIGRPVPPVQVRHSHLLQIAPALAVDEVEVNWPPYAAMRSGDVVLLHAIRDPDGSATEDVYSFNVTAQNVGQAAKWYLSKTLLTIALKLKKPVDLYVEVQLGSAASKTVTFARQRFSVVDDLPIREAAIELPTTVALADPVTLDPANFPGGLQLRVPATALGAVIRRKDALLLRVLGSRDDQDLYLHAVADVTTTQAAYFGATLPQAWLFSHDGQDVTFEWQADRPGASYSGAPLIARVQAARTLAYPNVPSATAEDEENGDFKGFIEPAKFMRTGLRVEVPDDFSIAPDEVLTVHYEGELAGGRYQTTVPICADLPRVFLIPPQYLAPSMGSERKRAAIYYTAVAKAECNTAIELRRGAGDA